MPIEPPKPKPPPVLHEPAGLARARPDSNELLRVMHPTSRAIYDIRRWQLPNHRGYLLVPWNCICKGRCRCPQRPTVPPKDKLEEATEDLQKALAGVNLTREAQGLPQLELAEAGKKKS